MTDRANYRDYRLSREEALALCFAALYGLYSATALDDSSNPVAAHQFKVKALAGLRASELDATQVHRLIERVMREGSSDSG